jgi:hypothetical protein
VAAQLAGDGNGWKRIRDLEPADEPTWLEQLGCVLVQVGGQGIQRVVTRIGGPDQFTDVAHQTARYARHLLEAALRTLRAGLAPGQFREHGNPRQIGTQSVMHILRDAKTLQLQRVLTLEIPDALQPSLAGAKNANTRYHRTHRATEVQGPTPVHDANRHRAPGG